MDTTSMEETSKQSRASWKWDSSVISWAFKLKLMHIAWKINILTSTHKYMMHIQLRDTGYISLKLIRETDLEGRPRITNADIQRIYRRAMTYGHGSSTGRGGNKHYSLVQTKYRSQVNNNHGDQGESVEGIMAMGFICIRLNNNYETHAHFVKLNHLSRRMDCLL
eukprot:11476464-Heterocapsa_arctica.AAC.1